jgi:hypothetical protein
MSEVKFTPGPWNLTPGSWGERLAIYHDCYPIAVAYTGESANWIGENPIGRKRALANARLIAESPEMYRLLNLALLWMTSKSRDEACAKSLTEDICAALARVEARDEQ